LCFVEERNRTNEKKNVEIHADEDEGNKKKKRR
jgi:hypothetical protein